MSEVYYQNNIGIPIGIPIHHSARNLEGMKDGDYINGIEI